MPVLQDSYTTGEDGLKTGPWDYVWHGQTFTPTTAYEITSVKVKLSKVGTGGTITIRIQEVNGSGPDGVDLCSGTNSDNDAGNVWREITFSSPANLSIGTEYAIVVSCDGADGNNTLRWAMDSNSSYAGALWDSVDSGSNWSEDGNPRDCMFECWGNASSYGAPADKVTVKKLVAFANDQCYYET